MSTLFHTRSIGSRTGPRAFAIVALVCVVLLAVLAVAQVVHTHQDLTDADHCPLCIVMHSAAPVLAAAALILLVQIAAAAPVLEVTRVARPWQTQLFTRPPPSNC